MGLSHPGPPWYILQGSANPGLNLQPSMTFSWVVLFLGSLDHLDLGN